MDRDPTMPPGLGPDDPETKHFVAMMRAAAAADDDLARAHYWASKSMDEHGDAVAALLDLAGAIQAGREQPAEKPPLMDLKARISKKREPS